MSDFTNLNKEIVKKFLKQNNYFFVNPPDKSVSDNFIKIISDSNISIYYNKTVDEKLIEKGEKEYKEKIKEIFNPTLSYKVSWNYVKDKLLSSNELFEAKCSLKNCFIKILNEKDSNRLPNKNAISSNGYNVNRSSNSRIAFCIVIDNNQKTYYITNKGVKMLTDFYFKKFKKEEVVLINESFLKILKEFKFIDTSNITTEWSGNVTDFRLEPNDLMERDLKELVMEKANEESKFVNPDDDDDFAFY